MSSWFEDADVYALVLSIWIGVPAYIVWRVRSRRTPKRMKAEPVDLNFSRARRGRVEEINARYGTDYRGPGRKGEPFFTVEGFEFLIQLAVAALISMWLTDLLRPAVEWLLGPRPH